MTRTELTVLEQALLDPNPLTSAKALEIVRTLKRRAEKARIEPAPEGGTMPSNEHSPHATGEKQYPQFAVVRVGPAQYQVFESWWLEGDDVIVWELCTRGPNDPVGAVTAYRRVRTLMQDDRRGSSGGARG